MKHVFENSSSVSISQPVRIKKVKIDIHNFSLKIYCNKSSFPLICIVPNAMFSPLKTLLRSAFTFVLLCSFSFAQDDINITYPNMGTLYESDGNGLQVHWNYQSQDNAMQSLSWAYKLDEDFYGTSTSATQVDGNDSVDGSSWLSGVSYGSHTLYVALLDQRDSGNVLTTDSHAFTYRAEVPATKVEIVGRRVLTESLFIILM